MCIYIHTRVLTNMCIHPHPAFCKLGETILGYFLHRPTAKLREGTQVIHGHLHSYYRQADVKDLSSRTNQAAYGAEPITYTFFSETVCATSS